MSLHSCRWQPVRSPEAIAAEAAAQAQARAAQAHAAGVRAGQSAQAYETAREAEAAVEAMVEAMVVEVPAGEATAGEATRVSNTTPAAQAAEPEPALEPAGATDADAAPVVQGERGGAAGEAANSTNTNTTVSPGQRERAADVNPALPD